MEKTQFTEFYRTYIDRIYKFVFYRVGGNKEVAQDYTQDIFLKAFEAFERYDPEKSQASWIYTIARNHLINQHAKTRPGVDLEEIEGSVWTSVDVRDTFATRHDEAKLLEALNQLPAEEARLIRMKYLEGWPFEDLAEIFGKSSGALRVQARRSLKKVKAMLKHPHSL